MRKSLSKFCAILVLSSLYALPLAKAGESWVTVLPDSEFVPLRLSANGEVVIGEADTPKGPRAQIWSRDRGLVKLTDQDVDVPVHAGALSADGTVIAGWMADPDEMMPDHLFVWTPQTGFEVLPPFSRYRDERIDRVVGVTRDGKTVYFATHQKFANDYRETIRSWSKSSGYQEVSLGDQLYGTEIFTVSGDGTTWFASIRGKGKDYVLARIVNGVVKKTAALPDGFESVAARSLGTNRDGSVVILRMTNSVVTSEAEDSSEVWDANLNPVSLRALQGCSKARASVADPNGAVFGDVSCPTSSGNVRVPVRWTPAGAESVAEWLKHAGVVLPGWTDISVYSVSDDGHTILGDGQLGGKLRDFIARVD